MNVFVTGGSGFVGQHLIRALVARGDQVQALARSPEAEAAVRQAGAWPVAGDLSNLAVLRGGMANCDVVVHAAAKVDFWGKMREFLEVNVDGTKQVLTAALATRVRRLVHVSTEAVLAGGPPIVDADETWPLPPASMGLYPWSKATAEELVKEANGPRLETVVVRPRLVWGPGDQAVLPGLAAEVEGGRFRWISGGRYRTSTCHVRNAVEGILLAIERGIPGEAYFLTDGDPWEAREFFTRLLATRGLDPGTRSVPRWVAGLYAAGGEVAWSVLGLEGAPPLTKTALCLVGSEVTVSDAKARRELGYQGRVSVEDGLAELTSMAG